MTFGEDLSQARKDRLPQVMVMLRNAVIVLLRLLDFRFIPGAFDHFVVCSLEALAAIGC